MNCNKILIKGFLKSHSLLLLKLFNDKSTVLSHFNKLSLIHNKLIFLGKKNQAALTKMSIVFLAFSNHFD